MYTLYSYVHLPVLKLWGLNHKKVQNSYCKLALDNTDASCLFRLWRKKVKDLINYQHCFIQAEQLNQYYKCFFLQFLDVQPKPLTYGSGSNSGSDSFFSYFKDVKFFVPYFFLLIYQQEYHLQFYFATITSIRSTHL
jgi:hypothetical protein